MHVQELTLKPSQNKQRITPQLTQMQPIATLVTQEEIQEGIQRGGGGTTIIVDKDITTIITDTEDEEETSSPDCDIYISPKTIKLSKQTTIVDLIITNKETTSITPSITLNYTKGDLDTFNDVKLTNNLQTISSDSQYITGVRILNTDKESTAEGDLILSVSGCQDIIVPIEIELKNKTSISLATEEITQTIKTENLTTIIKNLSQMSFMEIFKGKTPDNAPFYIKLSNKLSSVLMLTIILGLLMGFAIFKIDNKVYWGSGQLTDFALRMFLTLLGTSIVGGVLWIIYIILKGGI
jgi:hypothetical protein